MIKKKFFIVVFLLFVLCIGCFGGCGKKSSEDDIVLKCKNPIDYDDSILLDNILITEYGLVYLEYVEVSGKTSFSPDEVGARLGEKQYVRFEGIINFSDNNKEAEILCPDFGRCTIRLEMSGDGEEAEKRKKMRAAQYQSWSESSVEMIKKTLNNEYGLELDDIAWSGYSINISIEVDWENREFEVIKESFHSDKYDGYCRYYDGGRAPVKIEKDGKVTTYENEYYESGCVKSVKEYNSEGKLIDTYEFEDGEW